MGVRPVYPWTGKEEHGRLGTAAKFPSPLGVAKTPCRPGLQWARGQAEGLPPIKLLHFSRAIWEPSQNGSVLRTPPFLSGFIACGLQEGLCAYPYMHTHNTHVHQHAHLCTHTQTIRALRLEHTQALGGMLGRRQRRLVWEKKPCVS